MPASNRGQLRFSSPKDLPHQGRAETPKSHLINSLEDCEKDGFDSSNENAKNLQEEQKARNPENSSPN